MILYYYPHILFYDIMSTFIILYFPITLYFSTLLLMTCLLYDRNLALPTWSIKVILIGIPSVKIG